MVRWSGRSPFSEEVDRVGLIGPVEALGVASEVEFVPKVSGWNPCVSNWARVAS